ncbi:MAG TPA: twin-arginine translocase subunit TatC [Methylomirabilota bacterium]|jgi:sec-independent protein translocase protein TatC|nr:twin-arginine translocase subunit TatC [Methylomirabilota bacterium]
MRKGQKYDDRTMPLLGHLEELRSCLIKALVAIALAFIPAYYYAGELFAFLTQPLQQLATAPPTLIGTGPAEAFFTKLKVSFIAALFLASPVVFYQIWQFVAPGLYEHERRYVLPFVFFATIFFVLGAGFCHVVVLPVGYAFFLEQYESIGVQATLRISEYLTFTARMLLAFGVTFELPVLTFFFARIGLITHKTLTGAFRYAVVAIFIVAAVLTPGPDVASQLLMAAPLLLLYTLSIGVAYLFGQKPMGAEKAEAGEEQEQPTSAS